MAMQPQNSLNGANAGTSVPQEMKSPVMLNANAMNNAVQQSQNRGTPTAQAVNQASSNPNNRYYRGGGHVLPPSKPEIDAQLASSKFNPNDVSTLVNALKGENALTEAKPKPSALADTAQSQSQQYLSNSSLNDNMFKDYFDKAGKEYLADRSNMTNGYAQGGKVDPKVAGQASYGASNPMKAMDMRKGGLPTANTQAKSEARSMAKGLMSMNDDVGTYAEGGPVTNGGSDNEVLDNSAGMNDGKSPYARQKSDGILKMAIGGEVLPDVLSAAGDIAGAFFGSPTAGDTAVSLLSKVDGGSTGGEGVEHQALDSLDDSDSSSGAPSSGGLLHMASGGTTEADNIAGYGPDGSPIIQNADGTEQDGNINDLLGRPSNAPTIGTGVTPTSTTSKATGNLLGNQGSMSNMMAKGGEEAGNPPPGSLKEEVADDIPAKLSGGEFVFSADVTRFYGLRTLNMMMQHARDSLKQMNGEGTIRHPGDGKNPDESPEDTGQFVQDAKPNMEAYSQNDNVGMAEGGLAEEQSLRSGGDVYRKGEYPVGRDNMVSSHPQGGSTTQDYAGGGIVTPKMHNIMPKANPNLIPKGEAKIPGLKKSFSGINALPKMKKGGLLGYNGAVNSDTKQSYIGS